MLETKFAPNTSLSLIAYLPYFMPKYCSDPFIYEYRVFRPTLEPWSKPRKELL